MISRYIGRMGLLCMHPASSPFPLLRSRPSPACVERPVKSHPETFCVGVSDSGDSGRIRSSGRMNNVYLFSRLVRPFTIEPSGFHKSFPPLLGRWSKVCWCTCHSDFAAAVLCTHHRTAAIGKTSFLLA
jgi:hypothetical protein